MSTANPVKGELKEKCYNCNKIWWHPTHDIHKMSIAKCPKYNSNNIKTIEGYADKIEDAGSTWGD